MKLLHVGLVIALAATVLVGCSGEEQATQALEEADSDVAYTSETLSASYDDALDASSQLALGILNLEETENAVTPEQAATLLPLWQALQGGVTVQAEVNAVLKQIEGTMTQEQLAAIAAMQLTQEDMRTWMQEQGPGPGGGFPGPGPGEGQGLSDEERATRRAEFGSGGGPGFGDGEIPPEMATRRAEFENMSEEDRAALRATIEAGGGMPRGTGSGMPGSESGGAFRSRQFAILLNPLIEMLTLRAAE